jgi:glucokinase
VNRDRLTTPPRSVWPALTALVKRVLAANPTSVRPRAVGVTSPGPIDHLTGAMKPVGMPTWHDFPLRRELTAITGLPVHLDTAGRGLAMAELWRADLEGAGTGSPGTQNFATLALGDEVDGALVANGRVLDGLTKNLGQFGHIIVEPGGAECLCGAAGCLTAYAGARAIEAGNGRELRRTPPGQIEAIGIMVARACASIAAMFDIDQIMIGGVVAQSLAEGFFDSLAREFDQRVGLKHLGDIRIHDVSPHVNRVVAAAAVAWSVDRGGDGGGEVSEAEKSAAGDDPRDVDEAPVVESGNKPRVVVIDATGDANRFPDEASSPD